ncbi:transmembrane protein 243-like [Elysia marginata]|uniref:Transmembrane protein 243-like n=1 Tax=Elysia marginata TaxID=1093978 RepID=A0AAV4EER9_9GAST|nr:transmembrane protein 243-like [Elysia marginata]
MDSRDPLDRPLFGGPTSVDRVLNLVVAVLTGLMVTVTLISALAFPSWPPNGINIFFGLVIVLICASHLVLEAQGIYEHPKSLSLSNPACIADMET